MKRTWALVFILTLVAFVVRLALVPTSDGIDWDGPGYMQEAERLGALLAGRFPSMLGERAPFVYPLGLPLLLRALAPLAGSTRDAGVALSLLGGTALVPLAFLLARALAGETAGLLAASWTCLDRALVERSATLQSESVFAALLAGALVLLLAEKLGRRRGVAAVLLLAAGASVRSIGLPVGLVALAELARRGEKRLALALGAALLVVGGTHAAIERRNGAEPYWRTVYRLTLWEEGEYAGFFDVDASGATIRQGTDDVGYLDVWRTKPRLAVRVIGSSAAAAALSLLPFLLAAPFGTGRRGLLLAGTALVGALVPLALLQHAAYMPRMLVPFRPEVFALAAAGCIALGSRLRLRVSESGARALALTVGLGSVAALAPPSLAGLALLGSSRSPRAVADAAAARIAAAVPESERVLRGPGGDRTLIALAGRCDVYAPATTPEKLRAFCALDRIRFVLHDGSVPLARLFAPLRLETAPLGGGQLLSRIDR